MTTYLVTGATGGLGRHAVQALRSRGERVRATGRDRHIGSLLKISGADFVPMDLARAETHQLAALMHGVDIVWHCAEPAAGCRAKGDFLRSNAVATSAMLGAAGVAGVRRFVHVSSPIVYFDARHRYDVREDEVASHVNAHGESELRAEDLVEHAGRNSPMRCVILRAGPLFGPHDQVLLPRLVRMHESCLGTLLLPRGGATVLDVTHMENVVHAMQLASDVDLPDGVPIYNVSNDAPAELRKILAIFFAALGRRHRIVNIPYPAFAAVAHLAEKIEDLRHKQTVLSTYGATVLSFDMTLNIERAKRELGYQPIVSLAAGLQRTADWLRPLHG